jgi:hypothetical protein
MLNHLLAAWGSFYANHAALRTGIEFLHVGGLAGGGGCAIAADLATFAIVRDGSPVQAAQLDLLARAHHIVTLGLAALFVSGLLLFAADVDTFLYSRIFWLKMGLIAVLLVNGAALRRGDRRLQRGEARLPTRIRRTAMVSLAIWFLTTLAGVALLNGG